MKKNGLLLLLFSLSFLLNAQDDADFINDSVDVFDDTSASIIYELIDTTEFDQTFDANVDSMLNLYYVKESLKLNDKPVSEKDIPVFSDSVYKARLEKIPSAANLSYNSIVKRYIEVYTVKKRKSVETMLGLSEHYFPVFDDIFDYYDVPNELKYMSIIESALNPNAYSRARAVGLWQFMYGTGKMYGLEINSLVDERRDPIKSTQAAAKYIKDLYNLYDDWLLAIAAYNCGPGNVNKAIRRAGGKKDFWEIYYYLPRETRGHVPAFIAATYTMNYYNEHNMHPAEVSIPIDVDTIMVNKKLHLKQVSEVLNIPMKQLQDLNPQFHHNIIPGQIKPYALRLPTSQSLAFIDLSDSIYAYKKDEIFKSIDISTPVNHYSVPTTPGADYVAIKYTVKSGDAVGLIAQWYNVRTSDLKYWNDIRGNMIRSGQKLTIYKHKSVADKYKSINSLSYAQKQARIGKKVSTNTSAIAQTTPPINDEGGTYVTYTVRSGDTLWDIAKQFPGVTDTDIMRWNNISNASKIKPGQKLRIKSKS